MFPLSFAGKLKGEVSREEGVDLVQESPGDVGDDTQGLGKVAFTFFFLVQQLLFFGAFLSPQKDGLQVDVVSLFSSLIHFHIQLLHGLGEVGLYQLEVGFQLARKRPTVTVTCRKSLW